MDQENERLIDKNEKLEERNCYLEEENERMRNQIDRMEKEFKILDRFYENRLKIKSTRMRIKDAEIEELISQSMEPYARLLSLQGQHESAREKMSNQDKKIKELNSLVDYLTHQYEYLIKEKKRKKENEDLEYLRYTLPFDDPSCNNRKRKREEVSENGESCGYSVDLEVPFYEEKRRKIVRENI